MASENIKDHKFLDLLDLSDSEVEEWIPDTDEEWAVTDEEDDPEPNHQERSRPESATTKSQLTKRTQQALALREHLLYASAPISCATILLCSDVLQSTVSAIRRVTVHGPVVRRAIDLSCRTLVISTSPTAARRLVPCPLASFQVNN
ncbi:hypothetical protein PoB_003102600 [Plakobranchus ocellatus]|uniref:Uncharacterized protein n=1 Tax=Plakobranchus ocellatus TaxID=259542 RepID=A0AAV4A8B0_9GAST|nr:hypothetical protein PoB_003102600 [Plakobranchus ocellatus]